VECTQFCVEKTSKQQLSEAWAASARSQRNTLLLLESEMPLFSECMLRCAQELLDTADILRDAISPTMPRLAFWSSVEQVSLRKSFQL